MNPSFSDVMQLHILPARADIFDTNRSDTYLEPAMKLMERGNYVLWYV